MNISPNILVVEDEEVMMDSLRSILLKEGYFVKTASMGKEGLNYVKDGVFSIVILDLKLPDISGMEVLKRIKEEQPNIVVIIITGYATVQSAVEAMKLGAYDFLPKPFTPDEIRVIIKRALEKRTLTLENIYLKDALKLTTEPGTIIGKSVCLKEILDIVKHVSPTDSAILIIGESGTGKELVARAIHKTSKRKDKPFITVDCGSLVEGLFESELFGHVKGSFTGAISTKHGRFELANGGTIFLDEIGNLSLNTQAKILRVIQEREITKVGSSQPIKVDVRIISATNQNLIKRMKEGTFREDLYYRINVVPIHIPSLRERKEDIPLLAHHFLLNYAKKCKKSAKIISEGAIKILTQYDWPGNVRELENIIERAVVLTKGNTIEPKDLFYPTDIEKSASVKVLRLDDAEIEHVKKVLEMTGGNKTEAAKILGIDRKTLRTKLARSDSSE